MGSAKRSQLNGLQRASLIPHGLSFKNSGELNKLIDKSLPGRPAFKRHEVMVGSEVSEVYFRDVVAYIKSL